MSPVLRRRLLRGVVLLALALVWVRLVLFGWLFPIIERRFDSPEIGPGGDPAVEVESLRGDGLDAVRALGDVAPPLGPR